MKKQTILLATMVMVLGLSPAHAADAKGFLESVDKAMKISGQMASGKVPYNPSRAVKEMNNIQQAVKVFETAGTQEASKNVVSCANQLKRASSKGVSAAKAGQGAFKAAYGDLLNGYKDCQKK